MKKISDWIISKGLMNITINGLIAYKEGSLLVIDVDKNKFAEKEEDLGEIIIKSGCPALWIILTVYRQNILAEKNKL